MAVPMGGAAAEACEVMVQSYWLYTLGPEGRIERVRSIRCRDDETAVVEAKTWAEAPHVELWRGLRLIQRYAKGAVVGSDA